jgi:hypothetical protein
MLTGKRRGKWKVKFEKRRAEERMGWGSVYTQGTCRS